MTVPVFKCLQLVHGLGVAKKSKVGRLTDSPLKFLCQQFRLTDAGGE